MYLHVYVSLPCLAKVLKPQQWCCLGIRDFVTTDPLTRNCHQIFLSFSQICPLYIFGNNPPQMVRVDINIGETRVWRLDSRPNLQPGILVSTKKHTKPWTSSETSKKTTTVPPFFAKKNRKLPSPAAENILSKPGDLASLEPSRRISPVSKQLW